MWLDVLKPPTRPPFVEGTLVNIYNLTLTKLTKQLDSGLTSCKMSESNLLKNWPYLTSCESQSSLGMEMWLDVLEPHPPPLVQGTLFDIPNLTLT